MISALFKKKRRPINKENNMLWTMIIGLIVGAVAKLLMPGRDPGGIIITMLLGIVGAMFANFIGSRVGWYAPGEPAGFIASVVGAVILLGIYRAVFVREPRINH